MMLSIIFEPMRFSQAPQQNRPGSFSCSHLQCSPERETSYFFAPTRHGVGFDSFDLNPFLPGWLERAWLAELTSMPISHSSFTDATKPRSEKAGRATEGN
jgi:hypothetical protein